MSCHHHHPHSEGIARLSRAFALGIALNIAFVAVELTYGYFANSLALVADAGHNLGDVLGLILAWGAVWLGTKKPSLQFTYGLRKSSILAALGNALLLLFVVVGIGWEAIARLTHPVPVASSTVITVAAIGIAINGLTAMLFARGRKEDLNVRGAFLHMAADALVSLGVVVAGFVIIYTKWTWLDPAVSLLICAVIIFGTWELLRDSFMLAVEAVPHGIDAQAVLEYLQSLPKVQAVHDLHVWGMSTTETALTAHLVVPTGHPGDAFLNEVTATLATKFKIHHATLQIELGNSSHPCHLESDEVV